MLDPCLDRQIDCRVAHLNLDQRAGTKEKLDELFKVPIATEISPLNA
jgi:hypothetical protein